MLYAGISSNCLRKLLILQRSVLMLGRCRCGHVAILLSASEGQMKKYFEELAKISVPLIIYNIPGHNAYEYSLKFIDELSHHENIVGIRIRKGVKND